MCVRHVTVRSNVPYLIHSLNHAETRGFITPPPPNSPVPVPHAQINRERNVKIRHLEGAAGMSGLIKTILVLAHGAAPPNLHASDVNPRIDLASLPAVLPGAGEPTRLSRPSARGGQEAEPQQQQQEKQQQGNLGEREGFAGVFGSPTPPLLGAVSSFGFGGTNAHVVLEGKSGAFGGGGDGVTQGTPEAIPGVAFLFTGQGSQYPGMGRELYEGYGEFRAVVNACDEELAGVLPRRLLSVLYGDEKDAGVWCAVCGVWCVAFFRFFVVSGACAPGRVVFVRVDICMFLLFSK